MNKTKAAVPENLKPKRNQYLYLYPAPGGEVTPDKSWLESYGPSEGMGVWRAARCVAAAHCEHYTRMRGPMFPRAMHHQLTETITPAPLIRQVQTDAVTPGGGGWWLESPCSGQ